MLFSSPIPPSAFEMRMGKKLPEARLLLLLVGALLAHGVVHADDATGEEAAFRPWNGSLGIHFPSESLFEETPSPGERIAGDALLGQTDVARLEGFSLAGDWRPFRNGFRLSIAMHLDPSESDEPGEPPPRQPWELGVEPEALISLTGEFEAIPYVGFGWETSREELDVNFDVGAFLPGEYPGRGTLCPNPGASPKCITRSLGNPNGKLIGSFRKFEWYPVVSLGIEYRF